MGADRIQYENHRFQSPVIIVRGREISTFRSRLDLLGKAGVASITQSRSGKANAYAVSSQCDGSGEFEVFSEFQDVFSSELGCISEHEVVIHSKDDAVPQCVPARPVACAIRTQVDQELDRLNGLTTQTESLMTEKTAIKTHFSNDHLNFCLIREYPYYYLYEYLALLTKQTNCPFQCCSFVSRAEIQHYPPCIGT